MAETSGFFEAELNEETGQWDREYFAHQFASYFKLFFGNGVFGSPTNQLKVLAGDGLKVIVKAGWAFIEGYWYFNEADLELTIDPNTTAFDRQDSIMCRLDMASKKITSVALAGVTDVVRDGNYYDLKLASVIVGVAGTSISDANIVDTRTDQTVCGLVTGVMKVQPTADLFAQFTAQFNLWFETIKGQLSGDVAGNLQNQIGSLPNLKTSVKSSLVEAINELTQKEVDVLDTYEEIMANTTPGKAAGGVGVKQGFKQLNDSLGGFSFQTVDGKKQVSTDGGETWENFSGGLDLLWTNPNPTSAFAAQTLSIDLSGYESIIIQAKGWQPVTTYTPLKILIPKDGKQHTIIGNQNDFDGKMSTYEYTWYARGVTVTDDSIVFTTGYVTGSSTGTGACIPLEIYGCGISLE